MRLFLVASLMTAFTSFASAESEAPRFAQPPPGTRVAQADTSTAPRVISRAAVRAKLATQRASNLARFRDYQNKGVFPSNTYNDNKTNVWLDEDGNYCAAATIIRASGQFQLVEDIAHSNNFIKLGDVKSGGLMDWILTSGLTQAEIAAIQEPFEPVADEPGAPRWQNPRMVIRSKRDVENDRLRATYQQVEQQIMNNARASLDAATDRLMKNPALARQLLAS